MAVFYMVRIKRSGGAWDKGVEVKDTLDGALQSFHAQLGAYAYGNNPEVDYVCCMVVTMDGSVVKCEVDNRIPESEV